MSTTVTYTWKRLVSLRYLALVRSENPVQLALRTRSFLAQTTKTTEK